VQPARLWARLLGLEEVVVEAVEFDDDEECVVVPVRLRKATKRRCGECRRRCSGYDRGEGRRPWPALDWAASGRSSRRTRPGCAAPSTAWSSPRCPGHAMRPVTPTPDDTCSWLVTHCLLKERLRQVFALKSAEGIALSTPG